MFHVLFQVSQPVGFGAWTDSGLILEPEWFPLDKITVIHPLIHTFTEHLLYGRHCARHWGTVGNKNGHNDLFSRNLHSHGASSNKQLNESDRYTAW